MIGIQEARTEQGKTQSQHYHILASGADRSNTATHGCELWYHKTLAVVADHEGKSHKLADVPVTVQWADPRRLIAVFGFSPHPFSATVLHVPCLKVQQGGSQEARDELEKWWQETKDLVYKYVGLDFCVFFIDANAPLATRSCSHFGLHGQESSNFQGQVFESFLEEMNLAVPSTFEEFHVGRNTTWTHPRGMQYRRDYVAIPVSMKTWVTRSEVMHSHDNLFDHEDHLPVALTLNGWMEFNDPQVKIKWDYDKIKDPQICQRFRDALQSLPLPTWSVHIDDHTAWYEKQLLELARSFFEVTEKKRSRPCLSPDTLELIRFKRSCLDFGRQNGCMTDETFKAELKEVEKMVARRVWKDTREFYDRIVQEVHDAGEAADFRIMFKMLTRLGSKKGSRKTRFQPLPRVRKLDGSYAIDYKEQQRVWLQQFAAVEAGTIMQKETLEAVQKTGLGLPSGVHELQVIPTQNQVLQCIRKMKRGKTPGPNMLPPDVYKAGDQVIAKQMTGLLCKVAMHAKEPGTWRGGYLVPLYKKGDTANPSSYRSIYISDYSAKIFHACLRSQLLEAWQRSITHLQYGGRPGKSTDMAHQHLQSHFFRAKKGRIPAAALFFDLRSAFYMVLREVLTSTAESSTSTYHALRRLGIHEAEINQLLQGAVGQNASEGLSPHAARLVQDVLKGTYFQVRGLDEFVQTHRGTRPGDPVGDILFNLTMSLIVKDVQIDVEDRTGCSWMGHDHLVRDFTTAEVVSDAFFADISYVDDCVFCLCAPTNHEVEHLATQIVDAMVRSAAKRGLQVNFDEGKTEMMMHPAGKGVRQWKRDLLENQQKIAWQSDGMDKTLRIVPQYKHLGTWLQEGCKHGREVQQRIAGTKSSHGALNRSFYSKKAVKTATKVQVFRSLSLSRLLYNAHVWEGVEANELIRWQNSIRPALYPLVRGMLSGTAPYGYDTQTLCGLLQMPSPIDALHCSRLRYLKRFVLHCPQILWNTIWATKDERDSWCELCLQSCHWLVKFYPKQMPCNESHDFVECLQFVATDTQWKGRVKAAQASCLKYRLATAEQEVWQHKIALTLQGFGVSVDDCSPAEPEQTWQCDLCSSTFASKRALAMHAHKAHGYTTKVKFFALGDCCNACGKKYHCRARLCSHLTTSTNCMETYMSCYPPAPDDVVQQCDEEDRVRRLELKAQGWWATKAFAPVTPIFGPCLPPANSEDAQLLYSGTLRRAGSEGVAFTQLQGRTLDLEPPVPAPANHAVPAFVMESNGGHCVGGGVFDQVNLARECAMLHIRCRLFVHFFSGYRRNGDLHEVLLQKTMPDQSQLFVVSIDMCMQKFLADLSTTSAVQFWIDKIRSGHVMGGGGGPPVRRFLLPGLCRGALPLSETHCTHKACPTSQPSNGGKS